MTHSLQRLLCFPKAFAMASAILFATEASTAERPNIVMIMCDDLGYSDVGFSGSPDIKTPSLDALAKAGTVCTSGYVPHPFCGPSRMSIMSGRYAHEFGGQYNLPPAHLGIEEYNRLGIPTDQTMISSVLQQAGYHTGMIGKWHMGESAAYHPNNRGFDDFYGFLGGGHNYFPEQYAAAYQRQKANGKERINDYLLPLQHNGEPTTEKEYLTDELSDYAVQFISDAARGNQPFFLYLAYNAPHAPMQAKEEDMAAYQHIKNEKRRVVAGMVAAVDRGVREITEALQQSGQSENTLVVFLSDNGGKPSLGSSNAPFRGTKGDCWEGGFRVPMFFHWPSKIPAGQYHHPVTALDFYPTFAALAGAEIPETQELDGKNIVGDLVSGGEPDRSEPIFAMRHRGGFSEVASRKGDWKAVRMSGQPWRLFHISEDHEELHDVASDQPSILLALIESAEDWSRTHQEPQFFDSVGARNSWNNANMPNFDQTFMQVTGAPPLQPVKHITDGDMQRTETTVLPASKNGVKLKKGDSTLEHFMALEKKKWDKNGWPWDASKVKAIFAKMDANGDGIASGKEKKAYWSK